MIVLKYTRKPVIIQMQLNDYIGGMQKEIFHMNVPKEYIAGKKALQPRKKRKRGRRKSRSMPGFQTTLDYWLGLFSATTMSPYYLKRRRSPRKLVQDEVVPWIMPAHEYVILQYYSEFTGYLDYLFWDDIFDYFNDVHLELEDDGIRVGARFLKDIIMLEMIRIQVGIDSYEAFAVIFEMFGANTLLDKFQNVNYLPSTQDFSRAFHAVPSSYFTAFFDEILEQCVDLGLVNFDIIIWDGQFIRANCSNQKDKTTGKYTDPEAGYYRHDGKKLGVGYVASTYYAFCGSYLVPVYCEIVPGNQNDVVTFSEGFKRYLSLGHPKPKVVIADAGPYAIATLQWIIERCIIPLINSRKNVTRQNVKKLGSHIYINMDYIPSNWTDDEIRCLYALRTAIERSFSHNIQVYNARRVNVKGKDAVYKHRLLILCLDLLKMKRAYLIGRPDLIGKSRVFIKNRTTGRPNVYISMQQAGYQLLDEYSRDPLFP